MFKRGKSYIYNNILIEWKPKENKYVAIVPSTAKEPIKVSGLTVIQVINEIDAVG